MNIKRYIKNNTKQAAEALFLSMSSCGAGISKQIKKDPIIFMLAIGWGYVAGVMIIKLYR